MVLRACCGVPRGVVCVGGHKNTTHAGVHAPVNMGGEGGGMIGTCELYAREEGGEANKGEHMEEGIGAPGTCYVGDHVVERVLGGNGPLFVVAEFLSFPT